MGPRLPPGDSLAPVDGMASLWLESMVNGERRESWIGESAGWARWVGLRLVGVGWGRVGVGVGRRLSVVGLSWTGVGQGCVVGGR